MWEPARPVLADPSFQFFCGRESGPRRERGLGSGVMITADGYVLTNNHVVEGARDIRVTLPGHGELTAKVVGADPKTDLAVLKVPGSGFPVVPFGDSSRVELAVGVLPEGTPAASAQPGGPDPLGPSVSDSTPKAGNGLLFRQATPTSP